MTKASAKKRNSKKKPRRPAKESTPKQIEFAQRLASLNVNPQWLAEEALEINLAIDRKFGGKPGQVAGLMQAARAAIERAVFESDDPAEWVRAGKSAGNLD
jgi:hypothetical protein